MLTDDIGWYVLFVIVSWGCWSIVRAWKPRSRRKWVTAPLAITRWQHPSNGASLVNARSSCRVSSFAHGFLIFARKSVIFTGNAGYASTAAWYSVLQISPSRSRGWNKLRRVSLNLASCVKLLSVFIVVEPSCALHFKRLPNRVLRNMYFWRD